MILRGEAPTSPAINPLVFILITGCPFPGTKAYLQAHLLWSILAQGSLRGEKEGRGWPKFSVIIYYEEGSAEITGVIHSGNKKGLKSSSVSSQMEFILGERALREKAARINNLFAYLSSRLLLSQCCQMYFHKTRCCREFRVVPHLCNLPNTFFCDRS